MKLRVTVRFVLTESDSAGMGVFCFICFNAQSSIASAMCSHTCNNHQVRKGSFGVFGSETFKKKKKKKALSVPATVTFNYHFTS